MDDQNGLRAWVLGGDGRYAWAARALKDSGLPMRTYGVPGMVDAAGSLVKALAGAELAVLPLRAMEAEQLLIGDEAVETALLPDLLAPEAILVGGNFPESAEAWLSSRGVRCRSVLEVESYQIQNAAVTAEAAVGLAMEAMERTLFGARVLIVGWGRIGKALAPRMKALGADVTVAARRPSHLAEIETLGLGADETGRYGRGLGYDLIVNTVPARIMDGAQAQRLWPDCVLLELASEPGGFPPELEPVNGRGLPGKWFPRTAGYQLADAVWECLAGEGRTLE